MINGRFILSYNDLPDIWRLHKDFPYRLADGRRSFGEVIITNF